MMASTRPLAHHIIPLDFDAAPSAVPESHYWVEESGETAAPLGDLSSSVTIPTIDLSDQNASKLIGNACETWGAFRVTGHDIPSQVLENMEAQARRLFSLPTDQKMKALRSPGGVTGYGLPKISPFFEKSMWYEGFTVVDSANEDAKKLWPNDYQRFCDITEDYQRKMKLLAEHRLLPLILQYLNISREELNSHCKLYHHDGAATSATALQLNSYPACPEPRLAMGLAPHTDTSLFTIIHQSGGGAGDGGLEVFRDGAGWVPVGGGGGLVVNLGDLFHILTDGKFTPVLHRAVVNAERHRVSVAYFYCLPVHARVQAFPKLVRSEECPGGRYRPVTMVEYIAIKDKHLNKALSFLN